MIQDKNLYLETFGVTEEVLRRLVAEGIARGGDYADLYFENTTYSSLLLRDGDVSSGGSHIDYGVGIRVLSGEKTGYAYSESTDWKDMLQAARAASAIAGGSVSGRGSRGAMLRKARSRRNQSAAGVSGEGIRVTKSGSANSGSMPCPRSFSASCRPVYP